MEQGSFDTAVPPLDEAPSGGLPTHVAIIMDGNGRWAATQGLARLEGHRAGAESVRSIVEESRRLGIKYLTLYAFSTENWSRPEQEVSGLMRLLAEFMRSERELLKRHSIRLNAIGDLERLPQDVIESLRETMDFTASNAELTLTLAISYGGRDEIVHSTRKIVAAVLAGEVKQEEIDESLLARHMFDPSLPDPDLLIRTSGEFRISNFLLWQLAYSEIVFSPLCWPAFRAEEFGRCLMEYRKRDRRFGALSDEQIPSADYNGEAGLHI